MLLYVHIQSRLLAVLFHSCNVHQRWFALAKMMHGGAVVWLQQEAIVLFSLLHTNANGRYSCRTETQINATGRYSCRTETLINATGRYSCRTETLINATGRYSCRTETLINATRREHNPLV